MSLSAHDVCLNVAAVTAWLADYRARHPYAHARISFAESAEWGWDEAGGRLVHHTGRFFAVTGFAGGEQHRPLIDQPEIGTQGLIVCRAGCEIFVLAQARTEPGNLHIVELGPTVQATFSNYTRVHAGRPVTFLELFHDQSGDGRRLVDVVLPELGSYFFRKYNRNIILEVDSPSGLAGARFKWVPLRTLCALLQEPHVVNNDARLLVGLLLRSLFELSGAAPDAACPVDWILPLRARQQSWVDRIERVPLRALEGWEVTDDEIRRTDGSGYRVIQLRVQAADREVESWDQPMIQTLTAGCVGLLVRRRKTQWEVLLRHDLELGNEHGYLLGPSLVLASAELPEVAAGGIEPEAWRRPEARLVDVWCAEEGGRFFRCLNRYVVAEVQDDDDLVRPEGGVWVPLLAMIEGYAVPHVLSDDCRGILTLLLAALYEKGMLLERLTPAILRTPPARLVPAMEPPP